MYPDEHSLLMLVNEPGEIHCGGEFHRVCSAGCLEVAQKGGETTEHDRKTQDMMEYLQQNLGIYSM